MVVVKMANLAGTLQGRCISDSRREDGQAQSVHVRCSRRRRGRRSGDKWAPARDVTGETNVFRIDGWHVAAGSYENHPEKFDLFKRAKIDTRWCKSRVDVTWPRRKIRSPSRLHVLFVGLYGLLVRMKRSIFMLTRFDVESAAGSRSCVSGVSGKAFREGFTKDNRLPAN